MKKGISYLLILVMVLSAFIPTKKMEVKAKKTAAKSKVIQMVVGEQDKKIKKGCKSGKKYQYVSQNKKIATVSKKGVVLGKRAGNVTIIRYRIKKGKKVKDKTLKYQIQKVKLTIPANLYQGNAYIFQSNAKKTTWKSSNAAVLTISKTGKVVTNNIGAATITATIGKQKTTRTVIVKEDQVKSLSVDCPIKTILKGENLDLSKITVTANYVSGKSRKVTDYGIDFKKGEILGNQTVNVSYAGKTASFVIRVMAEDGIGMSQTGSRISDVSVRYDGDIYLEDGIDSGKIKFIVTYEDGTVEEIYPSDIKAVTPIESVGNNDILITYVLDGKEYTAILKANVVKKKLKSLYVKSNNKDYIVGDKISKEDFTVFAKYEDGSQKEITDYKISKNQFTKAGANAIDFVYTESEISKTCTLSINVKPLQVTKLEVVNEKNIIIQGTDWDTIGMKVIAIYNNGKKETITDYSHDYNKRDTKTGERQVTIRYKEVTTKIKVKVIEAKAVSISATNPSVSTPANAPLNTTGIKVYAKYDNGENLLVNGWTHNYQPTGNEGTYNVTISFQGKTCEIKVDVCKNLSVSASENSTIAGHDVILSANHVDVEWKIIGGGEIGQLSKNDGTEVVLHTKAAVSGEIYVLAKRKSNGEEAQIRIGVTPYQISYQNLSGGNIAVGDTLSFTTNAATSFSYTLVNNNVTVRSGSVDVSGTEFRYQPPETGILTVRAEDKKHHEVKTYSVTVRKELNISGSSTVSVGKKITLSTTKEKVVWSSSNSSVATISSSGVVKGRKKGKVTITATFPEYNNRTKTKTITVK